MWIFVTSAVLLGGQTIIILNSQHINCYKDINTRFDFMETMLGVPARERQKKTTKCAILIKRRWINV